MGLSVLAFTETPLCCVFAFILFLFFPPVRVCLHVFNGACLRFQVEQKNLHRLPFTSAIFSPSVYKEPAVPDMAR